MDAKQPKKLLIVNILSILQKYSDENHRLSQKQITNYLQSEYQMTVDRKAVRRNLMLLLDCGYPIEYSETPRRAAKGGASRSDRPGAEAEEGAALLSDFYLEKTFTDSELRLLIDSLLFSRHIPHAQLREMIVKLEGLSSVYFRSHMTHIASMPSEEAGDNRQLFFNIEMLDDAINRGRKVQFHYLEYHIDKKLHLRRRDDGSVRLYRMSPYQMVVKEGRYYLICSHEKYNTVSNYRVDRIQDIEIVDEASRPFETLEWSGGHDLDLQAYMREHPHMYAGENLHAKFRFPAKWLDEVFDTFGKEIHFTQESEESLIASVYTNSLALERFIKAFAPHMELLEPRSLREKMARDMREAAERYGEGEVK